MLNYIWLTMVIVAVVLGGINGKIEEVTKSAMDAVKIAEDSGLMSLLARAIAPIMKRLFPDVPPGHPAMGSMTMNIAANMLGLSNAATPLGIKAMEDLETLNKNPGIATNAMCTFLTINTAGLQLIPATVISIMASAGSKDPTAIIGTTMGATCCALIVGVTTAKILERLPIFSINRQRKTA
jgi:spore maturation protein A